MADTLKKAHEAEVESLEWAVAGWEDGALQGSTVREMSCLNVDGSFQDVSYRGVRGLVEQLATSGRSKPHLCVLGSISGSPV